MGASIPKQFLPLAGRPVLMRTIERLCEALPDARIVVSLPASEFGRWEQLCRDHSFRVEHTLASGGTERFLSVLAALEACGECDIIAVHDGVRPLVPADVVCRLVEEASVYGSAVPVVAPVDSFRIVEGGDSKIIDRSSLRAVQTPQVFRAGTLRDAYDKASLAVKKSFTDDSAVMEHAGYAIHLSQGDRRNIKITDQTDLAVAETLFRL